MAMNEDQFEREKLYQASMNMFQAMLKNGLITEEQYAIIDTKMREKYRPLLGTLFQKTLDNKAFRVMYSTGKELIQMAKITKIEPH
jgi:hypothetical protein